MRVGQAGPGGGDRADWRELLPMGSGGAWSLKGEFALRVLTWLGPESPRLSCVVGRPVLSLVRYLRTAKASAPLNQFLNPELWDQLSPPPCGVIQRELVPTLHSFTWVRRKPFLESSPRDETTILMGKSDPNHGFLKRVCLAHFVKRMLRPVFSERPPFC